MITFILFLTLCLAKSAIIVGKTVEDSSLAILSVISTILTSAPWFAKYSLVSAPTKPPPITTTFGAFFNLDVGF